LFVVGFRVCACVLRLLLFCKRQRVVCGHALAAELVFLPRVFQDMSSWLVKIVKLGCFLLCASGF
jgi:hypothetical protein